MRLRVPSDLRVEFATFEPPPLDVDAVVLAGDISLGPRASSPPGLCDSLDEQREHRTGECGLPQPPT